MKMINLALRTEYSFKKTYGYVDDVKKHAVDGYVGVADFNSTFAHPYLSKMKNIKPIYGTRLVVVPDVTVRNDDTKRGVPGDNYIFIAKNDDGLKELNKLVTTAWDNFYWFPIISAPDVFRLSENVIVIAESFNFEERIDYLGISVTTPKQFLNYTGLPHVAINNNWFTEAQDRAVYQMLAGSRKNGDGYSYQFETKTHPQHILSTTEWMHYFNDAMAVENTHVIAEQCNANLSIAPMVKSKLKIDIEQICRKSAFAKGINLAEPVYKERLERELKLIAEKEYTDYFIVVYDMIVQSKKKDLVGPGRGSSGGSLVCYLLGITEGMDPIKFGLLFDRFIDINRSDLPDIDVDFPDTKRKGVIRRLIKDYGSGHVSHIANVNEWKPKSIINAFSKTLNIPVFDTENLKEALVTGRDGDERAKFRIQDTFNETSVGKEFIKSYPIMRLAENIEQHASHSGTHAAGIIVCNAPITDFTAINTRDNSVMCDKKIAEDLNLLKIDVLGLRTLTILEETAKIAGFDHRDYYNLDIEDEKVYEVFNNYRFAGIFQFEGAALQSVCRQMGCHDFMDIAAITSLARPGPLQSGGTQQFCDRKIGKEKVSYISDHPVVVKATEETLGCIIYQEQIMIICKEFGNLSWKDVNAIRKGMGKSLGEEYLAQYKESFIKGAIENGAKELEAENVWSKMMYFGSYGFNKSHAVAYSLVSFWTAWAKTYYPQAFAVASLNNAKDDDSALILLRDLCENDGIEYVAMDPEISDAIWSVHGDKIYGGLTSIPGIGVQKARTILKNRDAKKPNTPALARSLANPKTPFDTLYPCGDIYGNLYENPAEYDLSRNISYLKDVYNPDSYFVIGKITSSEIGHSNDYNAIMRRGGKILEGPDKFMKIYIMDDTDSIQCRISRFNFEKLNIDNIYDSILEEDIYILVKGKIKSDYRILDIDAIFDLTDFET